MAIKLKVKESRKVAKGTKRLLKDILGKVDHSKNEIREVGKKILESLRGGGSIENHKSNWLF